jgi:hypothetical protein
VVILNWNQVLTLNWNWVVNITGIYRQGTKLLEVTPFDSKCIFCVLGHSVRGYKWSYQHNMATPPMNRVVYENKTAFFLDIQNNRLIEFGVCNAFLSQNEMAALNEY